MSFISTTLLLTMKHRTTTSNKKLRRPTTIMASSTLMNRSMWRCCVGATTAANNKKNKASMAVTTTTASQGFITSTKSVRHHRHHHHLVSTMTAVVGSQRVCNLLPQNQPQQQQQRWSSSFSSSSSSSTDEEAIYRDTRFLFQLTQQPDTTPLGSFMEHVASASSRQNLEDWVGWWMTRHAMNDIHQRFQPLPSSMSISSSISSSSLPSSSPMMLPEWFLTQTFCIVHRLVEELEYYRTEMTNNARDDNNNATTTNNHSSSLLLKNEDPELIALYYSGVNQLTHIVRAVLYPWLEAYKAHHIHNMNNNNNGTNTIPHEDLQQIWQTIWQYETMIHNVMTSLANSVVVTTNDNNKNQQNHYQNELWNYWPLQTSAFDSLLDMVVVTCLQQREEQEEEEMSATKKNKKNNKSSSSSSSSLHRQQEEEQHAQQLQQQLEPYMELVDNVIHFLLQRQEQQQQQQQQSSATATTTTTTNQLGPTWETLQTAFQACMISSGTKSSSASSLMVHCCTPHTVRALSRAEVLLQHMTDMLQMEIQQEEQKQQQQQMYYYSRDSYSTNELLVAKQAQLLKLTNALLMAWAHLQGGVVIMPPSNQTEAAQNNNNNTNSSSLSPDGGDIVWIADRVESLMVQQFFKKQQQHANSNDNNTNNEINNNTNESNNENNMDDTINTTNISCLRPNATSYLAILMAWANDTASSHSGPRRHNHHHHHHHHRTLPNNADSSLQVPSPLDHEDNVSWQRVLFWLQHQEQQQSQQQLSSLLSSSSTTAAGATPKQPVLTSVEYQVLIATYAAQGKVEESEYLLKYMTNLFVQHHDMRYCPTVRCYNMVINAWAKRRHSQAGVRAQELLHHLQELTQQLWEEHQNNNKNNKNNNNNNDDNNSIISPFHNTYDENDDEDAAWIETWKPDVVTYNSVLKAWVESGHEDAALKCEELVQQMMLSSSNDDNANNDGSTANNTIMKRVKPDSFTITTIMDAWASRAKQQQKHQPQQERVNSALRAEYWLRYLEGQQETSSSTSSTSTAGGNHDTTHNDDNVAIHFEPIELTVAYNTVIKAWSACQAPGRAQSLLEELELKGKPNRYTYGTLIHAWGQTARGATHAQTVFDKLLKCSASNPNLAPTVIEYNSLIHAWAKASNPVKAEEVLRQTLNSQGSINVVVPDTISYTSVIQAWSLSGLPEAPERVQVLLDEMENSVHGRLRPDAYLYATLLSLWAKHGRPHLAQATFDKLMARFNDNYNNNNNKQGGLGDDNNDDNVSVRPDLVHFNAVLDAWSKVGNGAQAEQLLRTHVQFALDHNNNNNKGHALLLFSPDQVSFNTVLAAWSRCKEEQAAYRAESLLRWMQELHESKSLQHCQPDIASFKATMRAWSKSRDPKAFDSVIALFQELRQLSLAETPPQQQERIQLDVETYVICLQALDRSLHMSDDEKRYHTQLLIEEMEKDCIPPTSQINNLIRSCRRGQQQQQRWPQQQRPLYR